MLVFPEDSVSIQRKEICDIIRAKYDNPVIITAPVVEVKKITEKIDVSDIKIIPKKNEHTKKPVSNSNNYSLLLEL